MQSLTAVVLGATGLIGEQLVQQLLNDADFSKVRILVRRPLEISHAKLETILVDFNDLIAFRKGIGDGDCLFCCIGTTQRKVRGDKEAYSKVDFDIPVNAAKMAKDSGFKSYLLVSAVGADAESRNFYLQLKGQVEGEVAKVYMPAFHAFRPSILLGKRKEFRLGELIGKGLMRVLSVFLLRGFSKYKGIEAKEVTAAMVTAAKSNERGVFVHHYNDMIKLNNFATKIL